jgi:hypothetical protein
MTALVDDKDDWSPITYPVRQHLLGRGAQFLRLSAQPRITKHPVIGSAGESVAYPASFAVFGGFIAYQLYRCSHP